MTERIRAPGIESSRGLVLLLLTAGVPRILGALFLQKEPFGDAYCYIEQVSALRGEIVAGTFSVTDLYGFWLPLYQFLCSIVSLVVNQPVYVSKLVSAVAGTGVCVLVYLCSYILTTSQRVSLAAFLAIAFNPFHLEYSSSAMTDVPHALLVMACLYFVLTDRWTLAACLGAAACLIRLDSWILVALFPIIQFMRRGKVPVLSTLILAAGPAFWLFVCWKATGDPLASFHAHDKYMLARLAAHPEFAQLTFDRIWKDANRLAYSANIAVLTGCLVGLWFLFLDWRKKASLSEFVRLSDLLVCLLFFLGYFGFITLAYLTKNNTDIWHRYGLLLFSLGLPVLACSAQQLFKRSSVFAQTALGVALVVGVAQFESQAVDISRFVAHEGRSQAIANHLKQAYALDPSIKIFCDDPSVRVMSGIPREQFYSSFSDIPRDRQGFLEFLRTNGIKFLVIPEEHETSTPSQLFPNLVTETGGALEGVIPAPDNRRADSLYRVRAEDLSPPS